MVLLNDELPNVPPNSYGTLAKCEQEKVFRISVESKTFDGESFETTFVAIGPLLKALERSPSFDLEFDLEGQVAQP